MKLEHTKEIQCRVCGAFESLEFLDDMLWTNGGIDVDGIRYPSLGKWYQVDNQIKHRCKEG